MMKIIKYPDRKDWSNILQRPSIDSSSLEETVTAYFTGSERKG